MQYRKEIDGLRAIAVVPVILFHAGVPYFNGGFIGVDIFFVISGYLITTIISSEIERGIFSIANFYERRARRIMPMLFCILFLCSIYSWFCLQPSDLKSFASSVISVVFFYSNFHFYFESGYWEISSELKPLLHTWSLAVEEQFYLIFPVLLLIVKRLKKSMLLITVVGLTVMSLGISQWASIHAPTANFYLIFTRFWELAIGAIIGLVNVKYKSFYTKITQNHKANNMLSLLGMAMIVSSILFFTESTPFPGIAALLPTLGTLLIIVFASNVGLVGKVLSTPVMVKIGLISYSAYLWHQPILAFAKYQSFPELSGVTKAILVLLVFPISYLSWKYVESPFRNKSIFPKRRIFSFWATGTLIFATIGIAGIVNNGYDNRKLVSSQKVLNYQPDNKILLTESLTPIKLFAQKFNYEYETIGSDFDNQLWYDTLNTKRKLLVIGNSHGENFYNVISSSDSIKAHFQLARYGAQIRTINNADSKLLSSPNYKHSNVVVICSRLNKEDLQKLDGVIARMDLDGKFVILVKNVFLFNTFGARTLADFVIQKEISRGSNMNDPQIISNLVNTINTEYYSEFINGRKTDLDYFEAETFKKLSLKFKNLVILDRMDYMCEHDKKTCLVLGNKLEKYIFDDAHNTKQAYDFYGKRIDRLNWMKLPIVNATLAN